MTGYPMPWSSTAACPNDAGVRAAVAVTGPGPRQIACPVDQRVPSIGGVGQIHRDLGILDPLARGHRKIICAPHKPGLITQWPYLCHAASPKTTKSGCRTSSLPCCALSSRAKPAIRDGRDPEVAPE